MEVSEKTGHPIFKSVLIFAFAMLVLSFGSGLAFGLLTASHFLPIYLRSVLVGLTRIVVPTAAAALWFRVKMARRMSPGERLSFAIGVMATNFILLVGGAGLSLLLRGSALLARYGISTEMLFKKFVFGIVLTWADFFSHVLIFAQAYFIAWIVTRNSAGDGARELERVFGDT